MRADYTPMHSLTGGLFLQFKNENYTYPAANARRHQRHPRDRAADRRWPGRQAGLRADRRAGHQLSAHAKSSNIHLFYTYELLFYNNTRQRRLFDHRQCHHRGMRREAPGTSRTSETSSTHTIGFSGEWKVNEKLKLRADYTLSYGTVMFGEFNGVFVHQSDASYQNVSQLSGHQLADEQRDQADRDLPADAEHAN